MRPGPAGVGHSVAPRMNVVVPRADELDEVGPGVFPYFKMAGWTGLEPATSDVTGRRSNQLNYHPAKVGARGGGEVDETWWAVQGSNLRPPACKTSALPLS
jgi:hypothetical protein